MKPLTKKDKKEVCFDCVDNHTSGRYYLEEDVLGAIELLKKEQDKLKDNLANIINEYEIKENDWFVIQSILNHLSWKIDEAFQIQDCCDVDGLVIERLRKFPKDKRISIG